MTSDGKQLTVQSDERELGLAETFVLLADSLVADYDVVDVLAHLVRTCVELLSVTAAGMLLDDQSGGLAVVASSSDDALLLEVLQVQHAEGPCRDCVRTGRPVRSDDLSADADRWPVFVPAALGVGLRSVVAVPLRLRGETIGALGLFHEQAVALPDADQRLAQAFADVATIGIVHQRSAHRHSAMAEQLRMALDSRVVIEQAKGVLAERNNVPMTRAFELLRAHARNNNLKLTAVAEAVVNGELVLSVTGPA